MAKALTRCPVCDGTLAISELSCARCQTTIRSTFDPCRFCRLAPEHLAFVELFLRCEGNLSRVERELNLSYPTVRNKLSAALTALGLTEEKEPEPMPVPPPLEYETQRRELLDALAAGQINAEEAARALRDLT
jgi:hypothetical protein